VVATSRPETMFGDVAIAVNPEDERYKDFVGEYVILPIVGRKIPVIADPYPDPEKGTGAVKITPAHDANDFEVGQRHDLEVLSCINKDATMNELAGKYAGMDRYECRRAWVKDLDDAGYLVKTEKMVIPVGECYRCRTVIEPMISDQWFVKMDELAKPAIDAVESGKIKFIPDRFAKTYLRWLYDIRDWCISRQLWWGHRIPAWYCQDCGRIIVSEEEPKSCPDCGSTDLKQDEDVLDTWFSSALWPFSTLGWPDKTEDLDYFYPTSVMVTAYDIIFFWVVRMVFSGCEAMGDVPFRDVFIHGIVRDAEGRKMSKSLGNGVDPLKVIDEYGADALRFMLSTGITPGNDMRFTYDRLESARNFANKLWNASRFTIMNIKAEDGSFLPMTDGRSGALRDEDKWIIDRVSDAIDYVDTAMARYDLAMAGQRIYDLIWNEFCDWYIEFVKKRLWSDDEEDKKVARGVLVRELIDMLKLLHPFMPFITEEIYGFLPHEEGYLIKASWPVSSDEDRFPAESAKVSLAMSMIKAVRNIRTEAEASPAKELSAYFVAQGSALSSLKDEERLICDIANVKEAFFSEDSEGVPKEVMSAVENGVEIYIPLDELVDFNAEYARLTKEQKRLESEVKRASGKLANQGFVSKAPQRLIDEEKAKLAAYQEDLDKVNDRLAMIAAKIGK
ncbi:MAG: valine--tRNA ligase, partial [Eubacterium sp.]